LKCGGIKFVSIFRAKLFLKFGKFDAIFSTEIREISARKNARIFYFTENSNFTAAQIAILKSATGVFVPSVADKRDLIARGVAAEKVKIARLAPEKISRRPRGKEIRAAREKFNLPKNFVLVFGENLSAARAEFAKFSKKFPAKNLHFFDASKISADEILPLLRSARAAVFLDENFKIEVLRAARFRIPLILPEGNYFREIFPRGAFFFDPKNPDEFSAILEKVIFEKRILFRATARAKSISRQFSWEKTARKIWQNFKRDFSKKSDLSFAKIKSANLPPILLIKNRTKLAKAQK
jgi:hypothetical protein